MAVESISPSTGSSSSSTLVGRLKKNDPSAWQRFSDLYGPLVYNWARRLGLQDSDAADVTQEVFRVVAERVPAYRKTTPEASFRGWLWGITRNKALVELRRRATKPGVHDEAAIERFAAELTDPSTDDQRQEFAAVAQRAMSLLRSDFQPATWQAFEQLVLGGRTAADVAAELGISVGSVYTAKCRVIARLRQELGDLL